MEMETSKEKKERLEIRRELEAVLSKILIDENLEIESAFIGILPDNHMVIAPIPVAEISGCHAKEIEQIEGIRKYVATRCKMIIKTMKPSRTSSAEFVTGVADLASRKIDATLLTLSKKLADCTCSCGEPVDPI
jgi:hypothetical protein